MRTILIPAGLALAALLAACSTPPSDTPTAYEAIRHEMQEATTPARPGKVEDTVSQALLPPVAELSRQMPKARQALEERFNVSFNNVPAQQFFNSLVAGTRYNMLVSPQVTGNISANLKDVTLFEALDAIRELYGYDYTVDGTRITIRPLTMQTRMFRIDYLVGSREGASNLRVSSTSVGNAGMGPNGQNMNGQANPGLPNQPQQPGLPGQNGQLQQDSARVRTSVNNDFWTDLRDAIETIVGSKEGGRSVVVNAQSGVVVIRAMPDELRNVDKFLRATQLSVDRQVVLEAKILEVELSDSYQSGINWAAFGSLGGGNRAISAGMIGPGTSLSRYGSGDSLSSGELQAVPGSTLALGQAAAASLFGLAFQTTNFAALMQFLESQGNVHVLSSPRVSAINNQKSILKIGTDEFFVTGVSTTTSTSAGGNTVIPTVTVQPFFSGVVLDVTPQIDEHDNIVLHVHPSVSQVSTVNKSVNLGTLGNMSLPLAASDTSEIDTIVRGRDGQVIAIGGLMRQASSGDASGLPGVSRVPVLGTLFGTKARASQKRELVVLIKPTIVDATSNWNENLLDASRRIEAMNPRGSEQK